MGKPATRSARCPVPGGLSWEASKRLMAKSGSSIRPELGQRKAFDYESRRNGTLNLFLFCQPRPIMASRNAISTMLSFLGAPRKNQVLWPRDWTSPTDLRDLPYNPLQRSQQ